MRERWLPVIGFEDLYLVSNKGNVKSLTRIKENTLGRVYTFEGQPMKARIKRNYRTFGLRGWNRKQHFKKASRLVAEAFIPNPEHKPEVNHKDGNKRNDCVTNLEWATRRENAIHAARTGLFAIGERHWKAKFTENDIRNMLRRLESGESQGSVARRYKTAQPYVSRIWKGTAWGHLNR